MTCGKCGKLVKHGSAFVKIEPSYIANEDGGFSRDYKAMYYHRDCFDKLFIHRNDNNKKWENLCTCGHFASYSGGGHFLCLHINVAGERYGFTRYYHLDHFMKYWMGCVCDGDIKC